MSQLLKLAEKFNCFYLSAQNWKYFIAPALKDECRPFIVEGYQVGLIRSNVVTHLLKYPEVFRVTNDFVELNPAFRDYEERSAKIDDVLRKIKKENVFEVLNGWREECYEVKVEFAGEKVMKMERAATSLFGIKKYGVSINGYVRDPNRGLCIWLQQRSSTKQTWPDKWDNMVSGGFSVGYGIRETAQKEAGEEASVPDSILKNMISAGSVSFFYESSLIGLYANTEFVFDLELPLNFVPINADGEVQKFELLSANECIERIISPEFKITSAPVILDFLIRKGVITPENEPNYLRLIELLHVPLQSFYKRPSSKQNGTCAKIPDYNT
ncbi:uncharacterized protein YJR142W [Agrilus planipennis]|uniref:Uncharacterized protein YJR142W n=1 Tax=Agrilus planipennis TaxID=224129 RepID=A0A7F5R0R6_AGRPL|nr:uncharacterized protein YJR142W [Agrilus planipennis]